MTNLQYGIAVDGSGDLVVLGSVFNGTSTADKGVAGGLFIEATNAEDVSNLKGKFTQKGGSFVTLIEGFPVSFGGDCSTMYDEDNKKTYNGISITSGISTPGIEGHIGGGYTYVWGGFNIFDAIRNKI